MLIKLKPYSYYAMSMNKAVFVQGYVYKINLYIRTRLCLCNKTVFVQGYAYKIKPYLYKAMSIQRSCIRTRLCLCSKAVFV